MPPAHGRHLPFNSTTSAPSCDINLQTARESASHPPESFLVESDIPYQFRHGRWLHVLDAALSVADDEVDYWSAEIARYRRLLDMQSLSFDTTKLAAARMSALANVSQGKGPSESGPGRVDPKQAFCRDFGVELNTL